MRKLLIGLIVFVMAAILYVGSAVTGLAGLADSARRGDVQQVLERVDLRSVRQSLVRQIVAAYIRSKGQTSRRDEFVANAVGGTIADAMLEKMLTPENVTKLLRDGRIPATEDHPDIVVPKLDLSAQDLLVNLDRIRIVEPMKFKVRLSEAAQEYYGIRMRFQGNGWRLSEVDLPTALVNELLAKLPRG